MSGLDLTEQTPQSVAPAGLVWARRAAAVSGFILAIGSTWQLTEGLAGQVPVAPPALVASAELSDRARAFHAFLEQHEVTRRRVEQEWALAAQRRFAAESLVQ
jgi:hypothetical protein